MMTGLFKYFNSHSARPKPHGASRIAMNVVFHGELLDGLGRFLVGTPVKLTTIFSESAHIVSGPDYISAIDNITWSMTIDGAAFKAHGGPQNTIIEVFHEAFDIVGILLQGSTSRDTIGGDPITEIFVLLKDPSGKNFPSPLPSSGDVREVDQRA